MTVHDFAERLAYSHEQADEPWWEEVYRRAFPDFAAMVDLRGDGWHQRAGRDRAIVLISGKTIYIDEKARSRDYGDVLIEIWSTYPKDGAAPFQPVRGCTPGWAAGPKDCDWFAYAVVPKRRCYMLPVLGVRTAWERNRIDWIAKATGRRDRFAWRITENQRYNTVNMVMPFDALYGAIRESMTIDWSAEDN